MLDVSRDQDRSRNALDAFQQLIKDYPKSEYVEDAKFKVGVMEDQLAGKEMSIGRFYLNRRNYTAAINRFRVVLSDFQTTRHTEEALYRLTEAYLGLGIKDEARRRPPFSDTIFQIANGTRTPTPCWNRTA